MKKWLILSISLAGLIWLNGLGYAECKSDIQGISISGIQSAGSSLTFSVNAANSCNTDLYYRFSVHPDYGETGYDGLHWESMTPTEWVTASSIDYTFASAGKYIVVVWVTDDTAGFDEDSVTILGCSVDVSGKTEKINITGLEVSGSAQTYSKMTFRVNAEQTAAKTLYYRFSVHPDYGQTGYDGLHWQSMTATEWVTDSTIDYTFTRKNKYIVVVWVTTDTSQAVSNGIPIIGWSVDIDLNPSTNNMPVVSPISMSVDSYVPYCQQQLSGYDPDGDILTYELVSSPSGVGYSLAYVNAETGMLYITNEPSGNDSFTLSYRASDGQLYSDPATVTVNVKYISGDENELGRNAIDPQTYSQFETSTYASDLLSYQDADASKPLSVDLSPNFPQPGSQGRQNSCVGWSVAYALKSYQERIEAGWSLNALNHLFSPAFIYNQINGGYDRGSYISDALDLVIRQGVATFSTMPYSDTDYLTQPSSQALAEAYQYKASKRVRINDTSQIQAALVNRRPVVAGIQIYESFYNIKGSNSVYNTITGKKLGGHAVTIVGYDDNKYGGAFKLINSWGQSWGDNGYFWLPYNFVSKVGLSESYVLEDAENGTTTIPENPTEPIPESSSLPNLTVSSWEISYDPRPGGEGELTYVVTNSGAGTAPAGGNVNLLLSENASISSSDYYVVYENIPFDLPSGYTAYRDESNPISFQFPSQLKSGIYYVALWVDDLNEVIESNENDNISMGSGTIAIENTLPDLSVNSWYATWDGYGNGSLTYEVANIGASGTTTTAWNIYLILDRDQVLGNGNEICLFYENAGYYLDPNQMIYRNSAMAAYFNIFYDCSGYAVPSGVYNMALWVDALNMENESNEYNNSSYSWGTIDISNYSSSQPDRAESRVRSPGKAYNGRKVPSGNLAMQKVQISHAADGSVLMKTVGPLVGTGKESAIKKVTSRSRVIFPVSGETPMPAEGVVK